MLIHRLFLPKRAEIEKALKDSFNSNEQIPLIVILIEGGLSSIQNICQALQENTPVLVIKVLFSFHQILNLHSCLFRIQVEQRILSLNYTNI